MIDIHMGIDYVYYIILYMSLFTLCYLGIFSRPLCDLTAMMVRKKGVIPMKISPYFIIIHPDECYVLIVSYSGWWFGTWLL